VSPVTAKLLSVVLATVLGVGGGVVVADLVSADDPDGASPIEVRKDDAGPDAELVDDEEGDDDARGNRDDSRSDDTRDGVDTYSDDTSGQPAAPTPAYPDDDLYTGDDGTYSDG
jgi:hypothetical protein